MSSVIDIHDPPFMLMLQSPTICSPVVLSIKYALNVVEQTQVLPSQLSFIVKFVFVPYAYPVKWGTVNTNLLSIQLLIVQKVQVVPSAISAFVVNVPGLYNN